MKVFRYIVRNILPPAWRKRIDLERRGIEDFIERCAGTLPPGARVLDAGAGERPYKFLFRNMRYVSIDFGKGESAWNYNGLDVVGNLESLPFAAGVFDAVLSTQVLEHVAEPERVIREMFRVLIPGGKLFLTAPLGFGEHQQPYDFYRYTRYGLRYLLEKSGFSVKEIQPRGGYFWYMAVLTMWTYIYLFPPERKWWAKVLFSPVQALAGILLLLVLPPLISSLDFLDKEKSITLGFAVMAEKQGNFVDKPSAS